MRLNDLDLNLLIVLDRLAREGTVSQTAYALGVSQPTVSNALRRLRKHFRDDLFRPIGGRMIPTEFADALIARISAAMSDLSEVAVSREHFDPTTSQRALHIVCSDYAFSVLVVPVVRKLRELAPNMRLVCRLTTEQTPTWLRQGDADFLILPTTRLVDDHPSLPLFEDDFSCVVWEGNKRIQDVMTLDAFRSGNHVSTILGAARIPHLQDDAFERHGLCPNVALWTPNFSSVADAVVGTDLIATMHSRAARLAVQRLPLRILAPPIAFRPFTEMIQWHRRNDDDPAMQWVRDLFVEVASSLP